MNSNENVNKVANNPKVVEAYARAREICSYGFIIHCPACGERQFSNFDRLFAFVNDVCVMHFTDEEVEVLASQIFAIAACS